MSDVIGFVLGITLGYLCAIVLIIAFHKMVEKHKLRKLRAEQKRRDKMLADARYAAILENKNTANNVFAKFDTEWYDPHDDIKRNPQ